tara:strand:- start:372 stop:740 length:369 start_codon:yes stop_codon:yes gene_type:complete
MKLSSHGGYPRFVDGERRGLPEHIAGTPGFEEFLEAMAKSRHPEHKSVIEWYGRLFDPADISRDEFNARMAKLAKRRMQEKPPKPTLNLAKANRWRFPDHAYASSHISKIADITHAFAGTKT